MVSRIAVRALLAGLVPGFVLGCGPSETFVSSPWPEEHFGVVLFATEGRVWPPVVVAPGTAARLAIPSLTGRLYARSFDVSRTAAGGTPLAECGVVVGASGASGSSGSPFANPDGAWVTGVFDRSGRPPPFARESAPLRMLGLRFETCPVEPDPCRDVLFEPLADIPDFVPSTGASTGAGRLWVAGRRSEDPGAPRLVHVDGRQVRDRSALVSSVGAVASLAAVSEDRLLGIGPRGRLFSLDAEGVGPAPAIRDAVRLSGSPGFDALTFTSTVVWELSPTSVVRMLAFGERIDQVFRYRERVWVLTERRLRSRTGGTWQLEPVDLVAGSAYLGGDGEVIVATGAREMVAARRDGGPWRNYDAPADGSRTLRAAGGLGSGGFLVAGRGLVAVWTDAGWCLWEDETVDYETAATDPVVPQTWVVGSTREGGGRILKVSLRGG